MKDKVLFLYPKTNKHLGLWNDLIKDSRVVLRCTDANPCGVLKKFIKKVFSKVNSRYELPYNNYWYQYADIFGIIPFCSHLVLVDGCLNYVNVSELKKCKKINPNIQICLYLINSINASSPILKGLRKKMHLFEWDNIYTFDKVEAKDYGFTYAGFMYYSKHDIIPNIQPCFDIHFVGGLKGNRTSLINSVYNTLCKSEAICDFNLMYSSDVPGTILEGANYYNGWKPYEDMLQKLSNSNCVLEILQEGQHGTSLRYMEAVCYNKKFLTNNSAIKHYPLYNPRYMKIFSKPEDIDIDWIKERVDIDYYYQNEFSPIRFIDFITKHYAGQKI